MAAASVGIEGYIFTQRTSGKQHASEVPLFHFIFIFIYSVLLTFLKSFYYKLMCIFLFIVISAPIGGGYGMNQGSDQMIEIWYCNGENLFSACRRSIIKVLTLCSFVSNKSL